MVVRFTLPSVLSGNYFQGLHPRKLPPRVPRQAAAGPVWLSALLLPAAGPHPQGKGGVPVP